MFIVERGCDDGLVTTEEVFDVVSRMTGEFANGVVANAVDGVPVQFIDAEQQVYAPLGQTRVFQLVPSCLRRYREAYS